jgi:hypothetical protein
MPKPATQAELLCYIHTLFNSHIEPVMPAMEQYLLEGWSRYPLPEKTSFSASNTWIEKEITLYIPAAQRQTMAQGIKNYFQACLDMGETVNVQLNDTNRRILLKMRKPAYCRKGTPTNKALDNAIEIFIARLQRHSQILINGQKAPTMPGTGQDTESEFQTTR